VSLRLKLALTIAGLVVPFAIAIAVLQGWAQRRAIEDTTAAEVIARMEAGERAACEADPTTWPLRSAGPPMRGRFRRLADRRRFALRAYDSSLRAADASGALLPASVASELAAGADVASTRLERGPRARVLVAVRMPWQDGPCAVVSVERPVAPNEERAVVRTLATAVGVSLFASLIAALAAGPLVRRIRRLRERVDRDEPAAVVGGHDEVGDLARAFDARRAALRDNVAKLEARDRALTDYVANTTHDVMVPLTVLQGHLVALEQRLRDGRAVEAADVRPALEESHYLAALVQNLSAAAKLDAGAPHVLRHPVDLCGVVERVVLRHRPIAAQRGIAIEHAVPEKPLHVMGDVTLVEQAVGNLVHNAVRYNREGGHVAIVLDRDGPSGFVLRVSDDGPGIAEAELARITERRFRGADARTRNATGLGLGLAIVREVAELHAWKLGFERPEAGGLEATLSGAAEAPPERAG